MRIVRVLIAEDNVDHVFLTQVALQGVQGVSVESVAVHDGEEALDYLHARGDHADRELPHLVLLDLSMPRKDGLQVLREVRQDPRLRALPIVVLTSSARDEDVRASYELGANAYVNKSKGLEEMAAFWTDAANLPEYA